MGSDLEYRPGGCSLVDDDVARDDQFARGLRESGGRDHVAEDILGPFDLCERRGADARAPQIESVATPGDQHQAMWQQGHRPAVSVDRRVLDGQQHSEPPTATRPARSKAIRRGPACRMGSPAAPSWPALSHAAGWYSGTRRPHNAVPSCG